jgi:hypothetical protein
MPHRKKKKKKTIVGRALKAQILEPDRPELPSWLCLLQV